MIRNSLLLIFLAGIAIISFSCKDLEEDEQYKRPDWLAGKIFSQIEAQPELSTFAHCIKLTGYDTVINVSGSYTVFAPNNEAIDLYLDEHDYQSVEDISQDELLRIVKTHIIRNPWSVEQLRQLDLNGWIDTTDETNNKPKGFKRETLLRDKDLKFGIKQDEFKNYIITDTTNSNWYRRHATDGNKYASIFYKEYFDIYGLNSADYEFYFGRPFDSPQDMYYMGGKIVKKNVFAENGFIHVIDRVVEPIQNAYEILSEKNDTVSYSKFLDLINTFPSFFYNRDKTIAQPGAKLGLLVDSLFDITYPKLPFAILNEQTLAPTGTNTESGNPTVQYQNGLIAPTNEAFDAFVSEYIVGSGKWGSIEGAPDFFRRIIVNTHMSASPIYPTYNNQRGFYNGEKDYIKMDMSDANIVRKQFATNCSFIGVKKALVPKVFSSVAGPIYYFRGYSITMYAIEKSGLLPALKEEGHNYSFFVESDDNCRNDSSFLMVTETSGGQSTTSFAAFQRQGGGLWQKFPFTISDLRTHLLNHIGTDNPKGLARKEFIKNLAGNFIIVNNETGEFSGTAVTKKGYMGDTVKQVINPAIISTNAYNGKTYHTPYWFSFSANSLIDKISTSPVLSKFFFLLKKAGLVTTAGVDVKFNFLSDNEFYTVFAPTNTAFDDYNADTIPVDRLKRLLLTHFIQGTFIFTDGKMPANYYETLRVDEKSTPYSTVYSKIYIEPGIDVINFSGKTGGNFWTVNESNSTNYIFGKKSAVETNVPLRISTAVMHETNKVLLFSELNTQ